MHVHGYKAQTPANKGQKIVNIVSPGNAFLATPGNKCTNSKIARYKDRTQTFSDNVRCTSVVCVCTRHTGTVYIYYPGNRKY